MQTRIADHVSEEALECYAMGQLAEEVVSDLEEHILFCEACQLQLERTEEFLRASAIGATELRSEFGAAKRAKGSLNWIWNLPKPVWAVAMVALVAALATSYSPYLDRSTPVEVVLNSSRGVPTFATEGNVVLKIDVKELPVAPTYKLGLVDAKGDEIWAAAVIPADRRIQVAIPRRLSEGYYSVRLFDSTGSRLLREFGFEVKR